MKDLGIYNIKMDLTDMEWTSGWHTCGSRLDPVLGFRGLQKGRKFLN